MDFEFFVLLTAAASSLFLLAQAQAQAAGEVSSSSFHRQDGCGGQGFLDPGQAYHVTTGLGRLGCAKLCAQEEGCLFYTTSGRDCLLYSVRQQTCGPSVTHPHASYYVKKCYNGGTPLNSKCACPSHTAGNLCQHIMRDCSDWIQWNKTDGLYWVYPHAAPHPFEVPCQMQWEGRTFVHWHNKFASDVIFFNKSWNEYKEGFGDIASKNFWLGLRKLHWLTAGKKQQFTLQCNARYTHGSYIYPRRTYYHFRIGDESTDFAMLQYLGVTSEDLADCVTDIIGSKFVTYDHGGNESVRACARTMGAGWWVKTGGTSCSFVCNPSGRLKRRNDPYQLSDVYFQGLNPSVEVTAVYMFLN